MLLISFLPVRLSRLTFLSSRRPGQSEGSFKHVAHMGYSSESGFSSKGVDPSWQALLDSLGNKGISQKQIMENEGFIRDFVKNQPPPVRLFSLSLLPVEGRAALTLVSFSY